MKYKNIKLDEETFFELRRIQAENKIETMPEVILFLFDMYDYEKDTYSKRIKLSFKNNWLIKFLREVK